VQVTSTLRVVAFGVTSRTNFDARAGLSEWGQSYWLDRQTKRITSFFSGREVR